MTGETAEAVAHRAEFEQALQLAVQVERAVALSLRAVAREPTD